MNIKLQVCKFDIIDKKYFIENIFLIKNSLLKI
jgi:hypothetical protein